MSFWEYLEHFKEKEKKDFKKYNDDMESIYSKSTIEDIIEQKLAPLEKLMKEDKSLKYKNVMRIAKKKLKKKKMEQ